MRDKRRLAPFIGLITMAAVVLSGCNPLNHSSDPSASPTTSVTPSNIAPSTSPAASPSEKQQVNQQAATWVRLIASNFEGVKTVPAACQNWTPTVDLTTAHFYATARNKEEAGAFGPDMGKDPCTVARNVVERVYRDPMLSLDVAGDLGFVKTPASQQAAQVSKYYNAPFQAREALANQVLGWYAAPSHVLRIVNTTVAYQSNGAQSKGGVATTFASRSTQKSTVLQTVDKNTGRVKNNRRLNCGFQKFVPKPPPGPPHGPPPPPPPGGCAYGTTPSGLCKKSPNPGDYVYPPGKPKASVSGPADKQPPVVHTQSNPAATPTIKAPGASPSPTKYSPPPPPVTGAPAPSQAPTSCVNPPGMNIC